MCASLSVSPWGSSAFGIGAFSTTGRFSGGSPMSPTRKRSSFTAKPSRTSRSRMVVDRRESSCAQTADAT
jgi:hypothetical protein